MLLARLIAALLCLSLAACAAGAGGGKSQPERIAQYGSWSVFQQQRPEGKLCFAIAFAEQSRYFRGARELGGAAAPRGRGFSGFAISPHRVHGMIPYYKAGTPISGDDKIAVILDSDDTEYPLRQDPKRPDSAFPIDLAGAQQIAGRVLAERNFHVGTFTPDGLIILDRFSTGGAGEAVAAAKRECGIA